MANTSGLLVYALLTMAFTAVLLFAQRDRDFPLPLSRRANAVVMGLNSLLAWIALPSERPLLSSPGWAMSVALLGAANLVAGVATLLRAVSLPTWLRILSAAASLAAMPLLVTLLLI